MFVRPQAQFYPRNPNGPPNHNPRMPGQHNRQQPQLGYPQQYMLTTAPNTFLISNTSVPPFFGGNGRPGGYVQQAPMPIYSGPQLAAANAAASFQTFPGQMPTAAYYYSQPTAVIPRGAVTQQQLQAANPAAPTNMAPPMVAAPLHQQPHSQYGGNAGGNTGMTGGPTQKNTQKQRRPRALAIVDPLTGEDKSHEIYDEINSSHPPSGDSSARQTPQPNSQQIANPKEVQALFAKQVAKVLSEDNQPQSATSDDRTSNNTSSSSAVSVSGNSNSATPTNNSSAIINTNNLTNQPQQPQHVVHQNTSANIQQQQQVIPPPVVQHNLHHPAAGVVHHPQQQMHHVVQQQQVAHVPHHSDANNGMMEQQLQHGMELHLQQQQQQLYGPPQGAVIGHHPQQQQQQHHMQMQQTQMQHPQQGVTIVQSNLQINAKEFVSSTTKQQQQQLTITAKELTPIVSANSDAAEIILPNKVVKDRESPSKARRQTSRDQQQQQLHKDSSVPTAVSAPKDVLSSVVNKDTATTVSDKTAVGTNNVSKGKEVPPPTTGVSPPVVVAAKDAAPVVTTAGAPQATSGRQNQSKKQPPETSPIVKQNDGVPIESLTVTPSAGHHEIVNAKSKHSRNASNSAKPQLPTQQNAKQPPPPQQAAPTSTAPPPVPQSQPAKASNKSNKKSELNLKGASKEGTDMDAFNDSAATPKQDINTNINNNTSAAVKPDTVVTSINNSSSSISNNNVVNNQSDVVIANSIPTVTATHEAVTAVASPSVVQRDQTTTIPTAPLVSNINNVAATPHSAVVSNNIINNSGNNNNSNSLASSGDNSGAPVAAVTNKNGSAAAPASTTPSVINKFEPPKLPKATPGFDVMNIVRDVPKPILKPFVAPAVVHQNDNNNISNSGTTGSDEIDRALPNSNNAAVTDRMATGNHDVNANFNETDNHNFNRTRIQYKPGQWSPQNPEGRKVYDRELLFLIRDLPICSNKPDNIPDAVAVDERYRGNARTDFIVPSFQNYGSGGGKGGSRSMQGVSKRNSQSGKMRDGNMNLRKNDQQFIPAQKMSITLDLDVQLHEVENAWKPSHAMSKNSNLTLDEQEAKTLELYKKVRSVLNKLTPQKFDTLVKQVRKLVISNADQLLGVINLVFEKAVDEPNFSEAYALMCFELQSMQAQSQPSTEQDKKVIFKSMMVNRCQQEFEKSSLDESTRNQKVKVIEACQDPEKKKELEFELDDYDRKLRRRSVGTIRFIGELFKQQMLTVTIMRRCLQTLLDNGDEESLECLCKLLATIGKELESKSPDLNPIFFEMKQYAEGKRRKISSRIRFMLQDVTELRNSKWVPRRKELNPKTIDQITKEAENEHLTIQAMNSGPMPPRKDDRGGMGGPNNSMGGNSRQKGRNMSEDGWSTQGSRNNRQQTFSIQADKLKNKFVSQGEEQLGSSHIFGGWGKGSQSGMSNRNQPPLMAQTSNMYSALEHMDPDRRPLTSRGSSHKEYVPKGPSMERNHSSYNRASYDGRGSRSGSQHRQDMGTPSSQRQQPPHMHGGTPKYGSGSSSVHSTHSQPPPHMHSQPPSLPPHHHHSQQQPQQTMSATSSIPAHSNAQQMPTSSVVSSSSSAPAASSGPKLPNLSQDQIDRRVNNSLEEYLSGSCGVEEYFTEICSTVPPSYFVQLVSDSCMHVLEKQEALRRKMGVLFGTLINLGKLPLDDFCNGYAELLSQAEDLAIDIPLIWDYFAEQLVDLVCLKALPLSRLQNLLKTVRANYVAKILAPQFKIIVSEQGPNSLSRLWSESGMKMTDFLLESEVDSFITNNKFEFLVGGDVMPTGKSELPFDAIQSKLSEFFGKSDSFDDIVNWIKANVGDRVQDPKFVRALATAIFEHSIVKNKFVQDRFTSYVRLIQLYVDTNGTYELHCLLALQFLVHKLEHPQGLLVTIFNHLYDESIISEDGFIAYKDDNSSEQEGKGIALKQLTGFFTQLLENQDEEDDQECSSGSEEVERKPRLFLS